ncbi:tRNA (guanosine(37)-N1)-methyltransferase TrmD, partial [Staphylococcus xylosus]|nr:tRNA (guanosine(37)-N1)-methyltransferase TrmD [Staphylococcus xylosus]
REYKGMGVPDVLLSGNHANIEKWRHEQKIFRTWTKRPDLLNYDTMSQEDKEIIERYKKHLKKD